MTPKHKRHLYNLIGVFLSGLFLYLCFYSIDRKDLGQIFSLPMPWFLVIVVVLNTIVMGFRAEISRLLLLSMKRIPFWTLFDVVHIGFMANNLLPLKAGDFFRASFVAKKWEMPYTPVLTTVGMERYFSGITLLLIFMVIGAFLQMPLWLKSGVYTLAGILVATQITLFILWKRKPNLTKWKKRHPVIYRTFEFFSHIGEGSHALKSWKSYSILSFYSLLAWAGQGVMLRLVEMAYGISIPWTSTLFVLVAINLAISLPSAPGNLGTFEFAAVLAYTFVGVDKVTGLGIGIFFHFLQVLPVTFMGLFFYFRWGLRLKDMERVAEKRLEEAVT